MQEPQDTITNALVWGVLAGFGGAVKYVASVIRSNTLVSNRRFLTLLFANIFISSFCGLIGGMTVVQLTGDIQWAYIGSGLLGYSGTLGIDLLMLTLRKKIDPTTPIASVIPVPPPVAHPETQA